MTFLICMDGDIMAEKHSTEVFSVRMSPELVQRFYEIKRKHAHLRVPNTEMILEAIKLYLDLAEQRGLREDLTVPPEQ